MPFAAIQIFFMLRGGPGKCASCSASTMRERVPTPVEYVYTVGVTRTWLPAKLLHSEMGKAVSQENSTAQKK